jgi:hypothetical protein
MKWLTKWFRGETQARPARTRRRRSFRPSFDALDSRIVPAVLLELLTIRSFWGGGYGQLPVHFALSGGTATPGNDFTGGRSRGKVFDKDATSGALSPLSAPTKEVSGQLFRTLTATAPWIS